MGGAPSSKHLRTPTYLRSEQERIAIALDTGASGQSQHSHAHLTQWVGKIASDIE